MEFVWPVMLLGLAAVPLLAAGYVRLYRQRAARATALADVHLQERLWVSPETVRRHVPPALYLLAVTTLLIGLARPVATIPLPVNRAVIVLAVDVSKSMIGEDVKPNRLKATQAAILDLLDAVPATASIGLVSFSDYAQVLVPPSTDRIALKEAVAGLHLQQATGIGTAVIEILRIIPGRKGLLADKFDTQSPGIVPRGLPPTIPLPRPSLPPRSADSTELPPAAIIIFSDGVSNIGAEPAKAAALAKEAKVKIYGVGVGTTSGSVMQVEGQLVFVPFDAALLQQMAHSTGGEYFEISASTELRQVYRKLGRVIGWERRRTELAPLLAGSAGGLLILGAALSLVWFRRVP